VQSNKTSPRITEGGLARITRGERKGWKGGNVEYRKEARKFKLEAVIKVNPTIGT